MPLRRLGPEVFTTDRTKSNLSEVLGKIDLTSGMAPAIGPLADNKEHAGKATGSSLLDCASAGTWP